MEEALFCHMGLLEVDTELQVAEHDLLYQLLAGTIDDEVEGDNLNERDFCSFSRSWSPVGMVPLFALDNIVESVQSSAWFSNLKVWGLICVSRHFMKTRYYDPI